MKGKAKFTVKNAVYARNVFVAEKYLITQKIIFNKNYIFVVAKRMQNAVLSCLVKRKGGCYAIITG